MKTGPCTINIFMILIPALILLVFLASYRKTFCFATIATSSYFKEEKVPQFLRKRTSSLISKKVIDTNGASIKCVDCPEKDSRKFGTYDLDLRPQSTLTLIQSFDASSKLSAVLSGYFSSAISGISKYLDTREDLLDLDLDLDLDLEHEHCRKLVEICKNECAKIEQLEIASKLRIGNFGDSDVDSERSENDSSLCVCSCSCSVPGFDVKDKEVFTGSVNSTDQLDIYETNHSESVKNDIILEIEYNNKRENENEYEEKDINDHNEIVEESLIDYVQLSDSDSESWEKVEANIIENVQVLFKKSSRLHFINRKSIIDFLGSVFVKLAQRLIFTPSVNKIVNVPKMKISDSRLQDRYNEYSLLDFETAHCVLYYNDYDSEYCDWSLVPAASSKDFADALEFMELTAWDDLAQIDLDLPRLPPHYHKFNKERSGSVGSGLTEKIRLILIYIMACDGKETDEQRNLSKGLDYKPITYIQGFDQIVAYFAINFDLYSAGTLTVRFFQLYMRDLIDVGMDDLGKTVRKIDARAVEMVRHFLNEQVDTALNFDTLLNILELYPFSDRTGTILYFNAATTFSDLDRLVQFLLIKVPQSEASKSISLLAAANMLHSLLALDGLFQRELGSEQWAALKTNKNSRIDGLDCLVLQFMGEMFNLYSEKLVHKPTEFGEFLKLAESLVPYLSRVHFLD